MAINQVSAVPPPVSTNPDDAVAIVIKMVTQAKNALDAAFPEDPNRPGTGHFSENNPDILSQVLNLMHADYIEAVRLAQRQAETKP